MADNKFLYFTPSPPTKLSSTRLTACYGGSPATSSSCFSVTEYDVADLWRDDCNGDGTKRKHVEVPRVKKAPKSSAFVSIPHSCAVCGYLSSAETTERMLFFEDAAQCFAKAHPALLDRLSSAGVYHYVHRDRTLLADGTWAPVDETPAPVQPDFATDVLDEVQAFAAPAVAALAASQALLQSQRPALTCAQLRRAKHEEGSLRQMLSYAMAYYEGVTRGEFEARERDYRVAHRGYQRDLAAIADIFEKSLCLRALSRVDQELKSQQFARAYYKLVDAYAGDGAAFTAAKVGREDWEVCVCVCV